MLIYKFDFLERGADVGLVLCIEYKYRTLWAYIVPMHRILRGPPDIRHGEDIYPWILDTVDGKSSLYISIKVACLAL